MTNPFESFRERCAAVADAWSRFDEMQLRAGEMTAQERRTVRAVVTSIATALRALDLPLTSGRTDFDLAAYVTVEPIGGNFGVYVNPSADHPYVWSFREKFQADQLADAIRKALSRPAKAVLTSAREVTVTDEMVDRALVNFFGADAFIPSEIAPELIAMYRRDMRDAIEAALASAPQPACVGVGEGDAALVAELRAIIDEGDRYGTAAKNSTTIYTRQRIEAAAQRIESLPLSPAPSPQAGGKVTHVRLQVRDDSGKVFGSRLLPVKRLQDEGEGSLVAVVDEPSSLSTRREG